ncbi:MAG: DUF1353 domain-containing protein [Bacteroidales bacterium]|nr:DUF1353 domain-containing protein [Bacteroidales bacterium]
MVTIKSIKFDWLSTDNKKPYTLTQPMHVCMQAFLDSKPCEIRIVIDEGFKSDGLSVPKPFAWFLKQWDPTNPIYNIAGLIHDWLYSVKGDCTLSREECDDVFRGILRLSGIGRFKAGVADKCVEWFAGGDSHWGNDSYGVARLGDMEIDMKVVG